ncbi:MAG: hypothetical protein R2798_09810 [Chitinophagales bacterium]|nr:hypothetical protein [Bacteroidota bacterium]
MTHIDKRNILDDNPFEYQILKDQKLQIFWQGKLVLFLKGAKAEDLIKKLAVADALEQQLILAKVTGNFKRGNEKDQKLKEK